MNSIPRLLLRLPLSVTLRCPHCRQGRIFRKPYVINEECPVCRLAFQRDEGDFWGGVVFSYTAAGIVGLAVAALLMMLGVQNPEHIAYASAAAAVVTVLLVFPYAKSLWIWLLFFTRGQYEEYRPPQP
ncbi:MAG TPA: DUF983 domain-containing protein [bacterium]|nr:DUF983 domain-containing protein [bacterium]